MTDDRDDRLDERIMTEARRFREPPATPRDEIWARIQAARQGERQAPRKPDVVDIATRRLPRWIGPIAALAAAVLLGVAIGRWGTATAPTADPNLAPVVAADANSRAEAVVRFAAVEHLGRVESLLTDYETGQTAEGFRTNARELLSRTRLLLDSKRLTDPSMRKLLEDLEVVLIQVSQLPRTGPGEERALIDDGMAEQSIRPRLRNAIPSGPTA